MLLRTNVLFSRIAPQWIGDLRILIKKGRENGVSETGRIVTCGVLFGDSVVKGICFKLHEVMSPKCVHKKMLHGCAEHNALAAGFAQGYSASQIKELAIYSECSDRCSSSESSIPCDACTRLLRSLAATRNTPFTVHLVNPSTTIPFGHVEVCPVHPKSSKLQHPNINIEAWSMGV